MMSGTDTILAVEASRVIATPRGDVTLRPERPVDDGFLSRLFMLNNIGILHQAGLPQAMISQLIAMQHRSQTATYRGMFPDARFWIVECNGEPIGRYIEYDEDNAVYIVDVALLPDHQARGIGPALVRGTQKACESRGCGARAKVMVNNEPSLKMLHRLGFVDIGTDAHAYSTLFWYPPDHPQTRSAVIG
ncbi:MAG TPA: GNAT family N-acetyltransferase [Pseudolabrys sp.]|jgi:GNAT superfamily N-acetyltransferase